MWICLLQILVGLKGEFLVLYLKKSGYIIKAFYFGEDQSYGEAVQFILDNVGGKINYTNFHDNMLELGVNGLDITIERGKYIVLPDGINFVKVIDKEVFEEEYSMMINVAEKEKSYLKDQIADKVFEDLIEKLEDDLRIVINENLDVKAKDKLEKIAVDIVETIGNNIKRSAYHFMLKHDPLTLFNIKVNMIDWLDECYSFYLTEGFKGEFTNKEVRYFLYEYLDTDYVDELGDIVTILLESSFYENYKVYNDIWNLVDEMESDYGDKFKKLV